ncbi:MAG: hypothetical protein Rubg2KO_35650 [Rubricoccaceae bacterium]
METNTPTPVPMLHRIEPVETYASLFRWAATYSLLLTDEALFVVRVGPAMGGQGGAQGYITATQRQLDAQRDALDATDRAIENAGEGLGLALAAPVLEKVEARYGKQVADGLERLHASSHEALVGEKGSFRFTRPEVQSFSPGRKGSLDTMELKTTGRDFQFKVLPGGRDELAAFARAVSEWAA